MRAARLILLAALFAVPMLQARAAGVNGIVRGVLTVDGQPAQGIELTLVNLSSGATTRARSGDRGAFTATLPPGDYAAALSGSGSLAVSRAPGRVAVSAGRESRVLIELVQVSVVAPAVSSATASSILASIPATYGGPRAQSSRGPKPCPSPNKHSTCGDGN